MIRRALLVVVCALLGASSASAWNDCGVSGAARDVADAQAAIGGSGYRCLCHDTSSTTDSSILSTAAADHLTVELDPQLGGTGTGCEVQIYRCTARSASTSDCRKMLVDTDGDGVVNDVTLDGSSMRAGMLWQNAPWLYVDVTVNPSSHACRTMVCGI